MATKWLCSICEISMDVNSRDSHVTGKKHTRKVAQTTTNPTTTAALPTPVSVPAYSTSNSNSSVAAASSPSGVGASSTAPIAQWGVERCDLCDITFYAHIRTGMESHVQSARHLGTLAKINATTPVPRPITSNTEPSASTAAKIIAAPAEHKGSTATLATPSSSSGGHRGGSSPGTGNGHGLVRDMGGLDLESKGEGEGGGSGGAAGGEGRGRGNQGRGRGRGQGSRGGPPHGSVDGGGGGYWPREGDIYPDDWSNDGWDDYGRGFDGFVGIGGHGRWSNGPSNSYFRVRNKKGGGSKRVGRATGYVQTQSASIILHPDMALPAHGGPHQETFYYDSYGNYKYE